MKKNSKRGYKESLGLFELVSLGLGGTIGSGIFVVPAIAAGIAGPSSLIAWIIVSISASCVMYSLAKASSKYPSTGAFYKIFSSAFSKEISVTVVIMYLISSVLGIATIAAGIGQYLSVFGFQDRLELLVLEILVVVFFCLINIKGMFLSGKVENVLTIAKIVPIVIIAILLLPRVQLENFFAILSGFW